MKKIILSLILAITMSIPLTAGASYKTNMSINNIKASNVDKACKLGQYYPVKGTPYKIAVEKYNDGLIRFKAKQIQKTYLYLAVPMTKEVTVKIKDRMDGIGGWIEIGNTVYQTGSFYDRMVKTACAVARSAGCSMTADEVGQDVMSFEFGE